MTTIVELKDPESDYVAQLAFSESNRDTFPFNCNKQWLNPPHGQFLFGSTHSPLDIDQEIDYLISGDHPVLPGYTEVNRYERL